MINVSSCKPAVRIFGTQFEIRYICHTLCAYVLIPMFCAICIIIAVFCNVAYSVGMCGQILWFWPHLSISYHGVRTWVMPVVHQLLKDIWLDYTGRQCVGDWLCLDLLIALCYSWTACCASVWFSLPVFFTVWSLYVWMLEYYTFCLCSDNVNICIFIYSRVSLLCLTALQVL